MKSIGCIFMGLFICTMVYADVDIDSQLEELFSADEEISISPELYDELLELQKSKLNLNDASYEELLQIPWLSPQEAEKILQYRKHTKFTKVDDLKSAGIPQGTIDEILPFISFTRPLSLIHYQNRLRTQYKFYSEYENPVKFYQRHNIRWENYELTFLTEKDEGESSIVDFWSGSISGEWKDRTLEKVILGNYRLAFGQGIIFSPKLSMSKSSNTTRQPIKHSYTLKPYTSSNEVYSLFGGAAMLSYDKFNLLSFYSSCKLDATLKNDSIASIYDTGYHRTETEKAKKGNVKEELYGLHFAYGNLQQVGLTAIKSYMSLPYADPNLHQDNLIFGVDFYFNLRNFNFFGEGAIARNKKAYIGGVYWEQNRLANLIIYRKYDKYFPTVHGNPFHTSGDFDNEEGVYYGFSFRPFSNLKINLYLDLYRFPEEKYLEDMPTYGFDKLFQLERKYKSSSVRFTYKEKQSENRCVVDNLSKICQIDRNSFRLDWTLPINPKTEMRLRAEYTYHHFNNADRYDQGVLLYQDFRFFLTPKVRTYLRICQYHTDDIILYMYENDVDGVMLNSPFSGDGIFAYILFKYEIGEHISLQAKYAGKVWQEAGLWQASQIKLQIESRF